MPPPVDSNAMPFVRLVRTREDLIFIYQLSPLNSRLVMRGLRDCPSGQPPRPHFANVSAGRRIRIGTRSKISNSATLRGGDAIPPTRVGGLWGLLEPKITVVPRVLSLVLCPTPHKGSDRRMPF